MITNYKGDSPTDEEIWEQMPQEWKDKIMSGYVERFHNSEKGDKKCT